MFPSTADHAYRRFQRSRNPAALATVFDRTAAELLRLARHLTPDEPSAEDLVQATFVTAIEAADDYDSSQRVLPWLLGILANHARAARRRARRRAPDPTRLRTEPVGDPGRQAEERELRAELATAIHRLPEAYRPVLRLHLEQGMAAKDIARTLERPSGTVRAQVTRGLDLLRRALPAGLTAGAAIAAAPGRGLQAVRAAVLGRWLPPAGGTVAALSTGAVLMLHKNLIVALSAALLFLIVGVAVFLPETGEELPAARAAGPESLRVDPEPAAGPAAPPEANERVLAPPVRIAQEPQPEAAPVVTGALRVRVTRAGTNTPAAGIGVALRDAARLQDWGHAPRFRPTDGRGEVAFPDLPPAAYMIELDRAGRTGIAKVTPGEETVHTVVLPAGIAVEGTVVDGGARPVPGAAVVLLGSRMGSVQVAESDAAGHFRVTDLQPHTELRARKAGRAPSLAHPVVGAAGATVTLRLVLEHPGHRVQGRVIDPEGEPVPGASVALLPAGTRELHPFDRAGPRVRAVHLRADGAGMFSCDEAQAGDLAVLAYADGLGTAPAVEEVTVVGDTWVELRLPPGGAIEGRVTRNGEPLAGVSVMAFVERPEKSIGPLGNLLGMRSADTADDGSYRIEGLMSGDVSLRARHRLDGIGETRRTVAEGRTERWDLALGDGLTLRARVAPPVDPRNNGPWLVLLHTPSENKVRQAMVRDGVAEFSELNDADCWLEIVRLQGRDFLVMARRTGLRPGGEVILEISEERLAVCGLRGRAVDRQRAPIPGATVTMTAAGERALPARLQRITGEDGTFAADALPPGRYRITMRDGEGPTLDGGTHVVTADQQLDLGDVFFEER